MYWDQNAITQCYNLKIGNRKTFRIGYVLGYLEGRGFRPSKDWPRMRNVQRESSSDDHPTDMFSHNFQDSRFDPYIHSLKGNEQPLIVYQRTEIAFAKLINAEAAPDQDEEDS